MGLGDAAASLGDEQYVRDFELPPSGHGGVLFAEMVEDRVSDAVASAA